MPAAPGTTLGNINVLTTTWETDPCCFRGSASYRGYFYTTIVDSTGSGSLFASPHPGLGNNTFKQITPQTMPVYEFQPFNGHMYVSNNSSTGYSVWRTDCTAPPAGQLWCPQSAFTQIVPPGAGLPNSPNLAVTSMHVYTDTAGIPHLYVGGAGGAQQQNTGPAELIRINSDDSWDLIVGTPRTVNGVTKNPLSGLPAGFGWPYNYHMYRMGDYKGTLYVGTYDDSTRQLIGTPQQQKYQPYIGADLWASDDGIHFYAITQNGFGDEYNVSVRSIQGTPYGLFVGTNNDDYGLHIYQAIAASSAARLLAPANLTVQPGSTVALTWDAARTATRYHVYRATVQAVTLPAAVGGALGQRGRVRQVVQMPGAYQEIGTTTGPYFIDHTAPAGQHALYYVVAQDAAGHVGAPSNTIATPALRPAATFPSVLAFLASPAGRTQVSSVGSVRADVLAVEQRLRTGDTAGGSALLESLRQMLLRHAPAQSDSSAAEELAGMLDELHQGVVLDTAVVHHASDVGGGAARP